MTEAEVLSLGCPKPPVPRLHLTSVAGTWAPMEAVTGECSQDTAGLGMGSAEEGATIKQAVGPGVFSVGCSLGSGHLHMQKMNSIDSVRLNGNKYHGVAVCIDSPHTSEG